MIQELKTGIYHNEYREQSPAVGDYIIFAKGRSVLARKESDIIAFPRFKEVDGKKAYI